MRVVGAVLIADGLLRVAGRGGIRRRRRGIRQRTWGALEAAFGLALLERAPVDPASLYRAVAPVYDLLSPIWRDWLYQDALRAFDAAIVSAHPAGADILDLGCGTGVVLERLLALDLPFRTYTGVDLSPAMLDRARSKLGDVPGTRFDTWTCASSLRPTAPSTSSCARDRSDQRPTLGARLVLGSPVLRRGRPRQRAVAVRVHRSGSLRADARHRRDPALSQEVGAAARRSAQAPGRMKRAKSRPS